jgi:hypothetical protein
MRDPARFQQYEAQVVVPEQTITRVLNPPSTNTETKSYTVAGVDPADTSTGLITTAQVVSSKWFGASPADEILVNGVRQYQQHQGRPAAHHRQDRIQRRRPGEPHLHR